MAQGRGAVKSGAVERWRMNGRGERVERVGGEGGKVERWESGWVQLWLAKGCDPSYDLLLRSDDLERMVRGSGSGGS